MKTLFESAAAGIIVLLLGKGIDAWGIKLVDTTYQRLINELWFVWVGVLGGVIYWLVKFLMGLNRAVKKLNINEMEKRFTDLINGRFRIMWAEVQQKIPPIIGGRLKELDERRGQRVDVLDKQIDGITQWMESHNKETEKMIKWVSELEDKIRRITY